MEFICSVCPRKCAAQRRDTDGDGFCAMGRLPRLARAGLHMWEEPCISGERGSGTVFFSGCSLRCVFCQNCKISLDGYGKTVVEDRLYDIFLELIDSGAHNINLVNPTHYSHVLTRVLERPLPVPVVWNSGGYDSVETLKALDGKVQIYLPDYKYHDNRLAALYSGAGDYPQIVEAALAEMFRQTGGYVIKDGIMERGLIVRHLVLPGHLENSFMVIRRVNELFRHGEVLFSLMSQYTPAGKAADFSDLGRRLTNDEYSSVMSYLDKHNRLDGYFQELSSAGEEYVPNFDLTGI